MTLNICLAILVVIGAIYALIKRYESRLVLLCAGFLMAIISFKPMMAFQQFDKSMTNGGLIVAICSAIGFAAVISYTKCDVHLVTLLTRPLKKLGFFLLPASMLVAGFISISIPTLSGLGAAVGPTMIPILLRAGFKPGCAAAAIVAATYPAYLNPGLSHNVFVSKLANWDVMTFIGTHAWVTLSVTGISIIVVMLTAFLLHDYDKSALDTVAQQTNTTTGDVEIIRPNLLYALAPLVPVIILVLASMYLKGMKISVATAMIIGSAYALIITRKDPQKAVKEFFNGMGNGYGRILGIIIAAGVFAAGLRACGVVDSFVAYLTTANDIAKIGGAVGPYVLGVLTGSGDAAAFAFNEAVTPHAPQFGMTIDGLGYLVNMAAAAGRKSSPLAGGVILLAGIAMTSPIEVVKRTIPSAICILFFLYFLA